MAAKLTPSQEARKALKWILRSGVVSIIISGLIVLLAQLQSQEIDLRDFYYGAAILLLNGVINLLDYYRSKRSET